LCLCVFSDGLCAVGLIMVGIICSLIGGFSCIYFTICLRATKKPSATPLASAAMAITTTQIVDMYYPPRVHLSLVPTILSPCKSNIYCHYSLLQYNQKLVFYQ